MPKNIIITCGTSLLTNLLDEDFYSLSGKSFDYRKFKSFKDDIRKLGEKRALDKKIDINCDDEMGECKSHEQIKKFLIKGINEVDVQSQFFKKLSAEISFIDRLMNDEQLIKQNKNLDIEQDYIYLFYSDTLDGQIVAEVLEFIFKEKLKIKNVFLNKINGFVVKGKGASKLFKKEGLVNFFNQLDKIKEEHLYQEIIMSPIGGYKAIIPYASLYAMVNGWEIKYIYEDSDEIIDLPSGSLTNLSAERLLGGKIDVKEIFDEKNLSNDYAFDIGLRLIFGIKNFIDYGKSRDLGVIFEKLEYFLNEKIKNIRNESIKKYFINEKQIIEKLKNYLLNLSDAFDLIRIKDIEENISKIKRLKVDGLKDLLLKNVILFLQKELEKVDVSNIVDWYFNRGRYAEAILIMREGIIDFLAEKFNLDGRKREIREKIEGSLKLVGNKIKSDDKKVKKDFNKYKYLPDEKEEELFNLFSGYENFWDKLTDTRNKFAHTDPEIRLNTMKENIKNLYNQYKAIVSLR